MLAKLIALLMAALFAVAEAADAASEQLAGGPLDKLVLIGTWIVYGLIAVAVILTLLLLLYLAHTFQPLLGWIAKLFSRREDS